MLKMQGMTLDGLRDMQLRDKLKAFKGLTVKDMRALIKGSGIEIKGLHKQKKNDLEEIILDVIAVEQVDMFGDIDVIDEVEMEDTSAEIDNQLSIDDILTPVDDVDTTVVDAFNNLINFKPQLLLSAPKKPDEIIILDRVLKRNEFTIGCLSKTKYYIFDDNKMMADYMFGGLLDTYTKILNRCIVFKKSILKKLHPDVIDGDYIKYGACFNLILVQLNKEISNCKNIISKGKYYVLNKKGKQVLKKDLKC